MSRFEEIQRLLDKDSPIPFDLPKLYLLGDTGAGKTTIIRKMLGTDDSKFPTTRQIRTTVAPTEYVIRESDEYDVTVVLKSVKEVEGCINEILREAITKFQKGRQKEKIAKYLKETDDQRFRLYYLLSKEFMEQVSGRIIELTPLVDKRVEELRQDFPDDKEKLDLFVDLALDEKGELGDKYRSICSDVVSEIQESVAKFCDGKKLESSWNVYKYSVSDQIKFIAKCREILSSECNSISPVVEHARIRGKLKASWLNPETEVVLTDGEGIGHATKESGQLLASRHYDYFYRADAILLIEGSKTRFTGGGKSALKSIVEHGYRDKLLVLFTKLDEVELYDVDCPTNEERREELEAALENVLGCLKKDGFEIDLPKDRIFYLGDLKDKIINGEAKSQINSILARSRDISKFEMSFVRPKYDFELLLVSLMKPAKDFNELYQGRLSQEHWRTVRAFSKRMVEDSEDGFRMFTPITDCEKNIADGIRNFLSNPDSWEQEVSEKSKQQSLDCIRREFTKLIIEFARQEIITMPHADWEKAYGHRGIGSPLRSSKEIKEIFERSIPPCETSSNVKEFKDKIKQVLENAICNCEKPV